jgi:hypothetical protein
MWDFFWNCFAGRLLWIVGIAVVFFLASLIATLVSGGQALPAVIGAAQLAGLVLAIALVVNILDCLYRYFSR